MDVLVDWEKMPWDEVEGEPQKGFRSKTCVRDGQEVDLIEFAEGYVRDSWCTQGHLLHVLAGESTLRFRDGGRAIRLRPGDTGIILAGEADAHRMEPAAGECIQVLLFEQP
jgi:quercetin dioxygenase-like cupin family protein